MNKLAFAEAVKGVPLLVRCYEDGWRFLLVEIQENSGSAAQGIQYPATGGAASKVKLPLDGKDIFCGSNRMPVELYEMNEKEVESFHKLQVRCNGSDGRKKVEQTAVELTPKEVALRLLAVVSEEAMNSKALAAAAEIEYTDLVVTILRRLAAAGKIQKVVTGEGKIRWAKK
jgi:hypothetical protein